MKKIRMATRGGCASCRFVHHVAAAQVARGGGGGGGGGGRNGGGRGSTAYTSLFTNVHLSQVEQKQVDSVGKKYDSVATAITTAWNQANGGARAALQAEEEAGRGGAWPGFHTTSGLDPGPSRQRPDLPEHRAAQAPRPRPAEGF